MSADPKDQYNLFNPTPTDKMREFVTDRPDRTESPYSVDAGHFQIESDIFVLSYDKSGSSTDDTQFWGIPNMKVGLTNNIDLQIVPTLYVDQRTKDGSDRSHNSGFGDTVTRLKINLWGNDGGDTAFAVMPFIKAPTAVNDLGNNKVEGGMIFPLAVALPNDMGLGLMTQINFQRAESEDAYLTSFINTASVGYPIVGELAAYTELYVERRSSPDAEWIMTGDQGVTYMLMDNLQLDMGINIGLTSAAPDWNPFVGFSYRI